MKHKKLILMAINVKEKTRINGAKLSTMKRQKVKNDAKPKKKSRCSPMFWLEPRRKGKIST